MRDEGIHTEAGPRVQHIDEGNLRLISRPGEPIMIAHASTEAADVQAAVRIERADLPGLLRALHSIAPEASAAPADKEQKRSEYCLQPSASRCPECKHPVALLYPEPWQPTLPIFYLCFPCERVGLIGSGRVPWTSAE